MPRRRILVAALAFAAAAASRAEVVDVGENGFTIKETASVSADPARAWAAAVEVGKWWDPEHTYSGDAANLSLDPKPQGCWCEKLPGKGGVAHMTVVFADPGRTLRLTGGLGPLQSLAVAGVMTWTFIPVEKGATVEMTYLAGGYNRGGFKDLAPGVDAVLRAQIERYQRYVNTGKP